MAGVADDKTNVVVASEVHSSNDLIARRNVHSVVDVVTKLASLRLGGERVARLISKEGLHYRRRGVEAIWRLVSNLHTR